MNKKGKPAFGRVAPGLYIGRRPPSDHKLGLVFDWIVLCAYEIQKRLGEFGRARVLHVPLDDTDRKKPTEHEKQLAIEAARVIADQVATGKNALITCREGRNRSSWVTALTMINLGWKADDAIAKIRHIIKDCRGLDALTNEHFVEHIKQYDPRRAA